MEFSRTIGFPLMAWQNGFPVIYRASSILLEHKVKIVVDENMPYAKPLFQRMGVVETVPGRPIPQSALVDADALMVRSVTTVNTELLQNTKIQFVGTATAGTDHVDESWLHQQEIHFASAPGCNAIAVVEYVFSALMALAERDGFALREKKVGIIGVGNVGSRLNARLNAWGVTTLLCDPPRADRGDKGTFLPLEKLVCEADILTFHTPLHKDGAYRSLHLVDHELLAALPDNRILINSCRGAVVDNNALLQALQKGKKLSVVLDVWENEPQLSLPLLARVDIGTPHIAGYTLEGKTRGTTQVFEAFSHYCGQAQSIALTSLLPHAKLNLLRLHAVLDESKLRRLMHLVYDVRFDDSALRRITGDVSQFDSLRKHYQERREWSSLCVQCDDAASADLLQRLGFNTQLE